MALDRKLLTIDGFPIDVATSEKLTYEADVTTNAVERGSDFNDHIRPKQPVLTVEGVVSDTPIGQVATDPTRAVGRPSRAAFKHLVDVYFAAQPITVDCTYGTFEQMALETLDCDSDAATSKSFKFSAVFTKMRIAEARRTQVTVQLATKNLGAREAILKFLGDNVVWVKSKIREADGSVGADPTDFRQIHATLHKPVTDRVLGKPVLSTTHLDRVNRNGFDRFGSHWVDHYSIGRGNQETDRIMLQADGYVLLSDTGPNPVRTPIPGGAFGTDSTKTDAGITANVKKGYYFLNSGGFEDNVAKEPDQDLGAAIVRASKGEPSITQRPVSQEEWDRFMKAGGK